MKKNNLSDLVIRYKPNNSALKATVESSFLEYRDHSDFLRFMVEVKPLLKEIVNGSVNTELRKVHLSASFVVEKPSVDKTDENELTLCANSKMETVFFGLSDEYFSRMLDQMLSSLFTFTSLASGWILEKINGVEVRLVSHLPIKGSSYLALPSALQNLNYLLNIRNHDDNNCFLLFHGCLALQVSTASHEFCLLGFARKP